VRQPIDIRVGVGAVAVDERDSLRVLPEHRGEFLRQRLALPIAFGAIALGKFRRKWNDALQHQVEAVYPPSMTITSPVTKRLALIRLIMVSATSSAVTTRLSGVALARLPMRSSYWSFSMRF